MPSPLSYKLTKKLSRSPTASCYLTRTRKARRYSGLDPAFPFKGSLDGSFPEPLAAALRGQPPQRLVIIGGRAVKLANLANVVRSCDFKGLRP